MDSPLYIPSQSLNDCLDRMQQAEKALYFALNEVVGTRTAILQAMGSGAQEETGVPSVGPEEQIIQTKQEKRVSNDAAQQCVSKSSIGDKFAPLFTRHFEDEEGVAVEAEEPELRAHFMEVAKAAGDKLGISLQDVARAYDLFHKHDKDRTGKISSGELQPLLEEFRGKPITKEEITEIMMECDTSGDAELDLQEFLVCLCHTPEKKAAYLAAASSNRERLFDRKFKMELNGIPYATVVAFLQKEVNETAAFLSIPIIFLLFFCFVLSAHLHREVPVLHAFANSIKVDIESNANFGFSGILPFENGRMGHKGILDVGTPDDFWSFMDLGLMPLIFSSGWPLSEARSNTQAECTAPLAALQSQGINTTGVTGPWSWKHRWDMDKPDMCNLEDAQTAFSAGVMTDNMQNFADPLHRPYNKFNEIVAGVRMRQEQLPHTDCERPGLFGSAYRTPCMEVNDWTWFPPTLATASVMQSDLLNRPGGETVYFKSRTELTQIKSDLRKLEEARWYGPQTSKVQILVTAYNNHLDLFIATYINFIINRAGDTHPMIQTHCIWLDPYRYKVAYVSDIILVLLVLKLFFEEGRELVHVMRESGCVIGFREYFYSFKNVVDWATISFSLYIFVLWILWCFKMSDFNELLQSADSEIAGGWPHTGGMFVPSNSQFWEDVDSLVEYYQFTLTDSLAYYPFVVGARFFSTFSSQPRLGLVTETLSKAAKDIIHFLVVLVVTLVIFCSSAELLFGLQVDEYENFGRTFISVFRAMLGDYDYVALTEVGRTNAVLWWCAFMLLVHMIMLNMLLVIIMDVYGKIKGELNSDDEENFPTIWSQTFEIVDRWRMVRKGTDLSIEQILDQMIDNEELFYTTNYLGIRESKLVTTGSFCRNVKGLGYAQANQILTDADEWYESQQSVGNSASNEDVLLHLEQVDLKIQRFQQMFKDAMQSHRPGGTAPDIDADTRSQLQQRAQEYRQLVSRQNLVSWSLPLITSPAAVSQREMRDQQQSDPLRCCALLA